MGITSTFWGVNVSCSRKQHTDPAEDQIVSPDPESNALTTRPVCSPWVLLMKMKSMTQPIVIPEQF